MAKVGRNDTCPCGSGKKYKYCCESKKDSSRMSSVMLALVAERVSDPAALAFAAAFTIVALACFAAIRRPQ